MYNVHLRAGLFIIIMHVFIYNLYIHKQYILHFQFSQFSILCTLNERHMLKVYPKESES